MHYVQFGSHISPNYGVPVDTHRHVIHLKNIYLHIYASLFVAFWRVCGDSGGKC